MRVIFCIAWAVALSGCGERDECENLPASLQLDVQLAEPSIGPRVVFLAMTLRADEARWRRRFPVDGELDDGRTSLAISVSPPPFEPFDLSLHVAALDVGTSTLAEGNVTAVAEPNGCNRFDVELR